MNKHIRFLAFGLFSLISCQNEQETVDLSIFQLEESFSDLNNDGSIDITGNATITYTGLEPITSSITATTREIRPHSATTASTGLRTARRAAWGIHDLVNEVTTTVENVHRSIAELPLTFLGSIKPLEEPVKEVREVQARSIGAIYGLIRRVNDRVEQLGTSKGTTA